MKKALFLAMALMAATIQLSGKITLPSIISDNMVLQQKASVKLWGWAEPGEEVTITIQRMSVDGYREIDVKVTLGVLE